MIYKKGRWQASYKDTWSLDHTLSPIIYAGLSKFHDVLEQKNHEGKCLGVPNEYMKNEADWVTDSDVQDWLDDIKKMMYAFENKEPDMRDYGFTLTMVELEETDRGRSYTIETSNEEESARFDRDREIHEEKVQEGLDLLAKRWKNLWW